MKKGSALVTIISTLVVLVVVNFLAARHPLRLDLTENNIYTLSKSTKTILKGLDDVVTIRAYFTENLPPALQPLRRDVDDILAEFKSSAGKRLQVEFVDPASSQMEEQKVAMMGIPPIQLNVVERDKQEVAKIYLGMTVMFGDKQQVVPVIQNINNLEYELAQAIIKVSSKELPKIAWWGPSGNDSGFELIRQAISRRYEVVKITEKELAELDATKFATLVLISPGKLSNEELFAIDQYLMSGGHFIALVDRYDVGQNLTIQPVETNLPDFLIHFGATVEDAIVLDQSNAMAAFSGGYITYHLPYPFWPEARKGQFNKDDPIVAELQSAVFPWTAPLLISSGEGLKGEEMVSTTQYATSIPSKDAKLDPQSAGDTLLNSKREVKDIAAKLEGPFKSYFTVEGQVVPKGKDVVGDSKEGAKIIVVGSSRWLTDKMLQTFPQNAALFENAIDAFAMGDLLIGIRSRETTSRPLELISDGARLAFKYSNMAIGPILVVVIGLVLIMIRRARRRTVQLIYR